jgi:hypothetical protein
MVFDKRVSRKTFGPKDKVKATGWRKLNKEVHELYSSHKFITIAKEKRMRWAGHVERMGGNKNASRLLRGKPEGKKTGVVGDKIPNQIIKN